MMKNLLLFLFILGSTMMVSAQDIYYSTDFDGGLPADWQSEGEWLFGSSADVSSAYFTVPPVSRNVACFNDDGLGDGVVASGRLTSGPIDLSAVTGDMIFEFTAFFANGDYQGADETASCYVSRDMGTTWDLVIDLEGASGWTTAFTDFSSYAGETVMIAFDYDDGGGWNFGFAIDQIFIATEIQTIPKRSYAFSAGGGPVIDMALIGTEYAPSGWVVNSGSIEITSFDVIVSDGVEETVESFDNVSIPFGGAMRYTLSESILVTEGSSSYTLSISNVNGSMDQDEDASNDSDSFNLNGIELNPDKAVVVEEATGTWCTWCPRGTVFLDEMSKRFGHNFVGIAVHNSDPMADATYDSELTSFNGFLGFPSVIYQRESVIDPADIVTPSLADMNEAPPAGVTVGGMLDDSGNFVASIEVDFLTEVSANHNVLVVLTEDGLSGTDAGYNQINAYGGGGQGPMGGFELLSGSVPAEYMVYDHVGRALIGGYDGVNAIVGDFVAGDKAGHIFDSFSIPAEYVTDNMHVIGLLLNDDGEIVNAASVTYDEALANGLTTGVEDNFLTESISVSPTLVSNFTNVSISIENSENVTITLMNSVGQKVSERNFGQNVGQVELQYNVENELPGVYFMNIRVGNQLAVKKITKVN